MNWRLRNLTAKSEWFGEGFNWFRISYEGYSSLLELSKIFASWTSKTISCWCKIPSFLIAKGPCKTWVKVCAINLITNQPAGLRELTSQATVSLNLSQFTLIFFKLPLFPSIYSNLPQFSSNLPQISSNIPQISQVYLHGERVDIIGPGNCLRFGCGRQAGVDGPRSSTLLYYLYMES